MPHELHIERVAHIEEASIRFGDLTVLVGAQATGKSILLQFHKLMDRILYRMAGLTDGEAQGLEKRLEGML